MHLAVHTNEGFWNIPSHDFILRVFAGHEKKGEKLGISVCISFRICASGTERASESEKNRTGKESNHGDDDVVGLHRRCGVSRLFWSEAVSRANWQMGELARSGTFWACARVGA